MDMNIRSVYVKLDYDTGDIIELEPRKEKAPGRIRTWLGWIFMSLAMSAFYGVKGWRLSVNGSLKRDNSNGG